MSARFWDAFAGVGILVVTLALGFGLIVASGWIWFNILPRIKIGKPKLRGVWTFYRQPVVCNNDLPQLFLEDKLAIRWWFGLTYRRSWYLGFVRLGNMK